MSSRVGKISVIIPVLNEAATIKNTLLQFSPAPALEVIVVDGGSWDRTVAIVQSVGFKVISSLPGRARQMNAGASVATGAILLFLHADTCLPSEFRDDIHQTLAQPGAIAGAFELKIDGALWGLRLVEWGVRWRSHLLQMPYGDQAIFLTAKTFEQVGGFPEIPIMEDFELVLRLRAKGRVAIAPTCVSTSGRRWKKLGILQTTLINQVVIVAYFLGVPPARIAVWYRGNAPVKNR